MKLLALDTSSTACTVALQMGDAIIERHRPAGAGRVRKRRDGRPGALQRIEDGSYGYCEVSGEEIGLKRLEARPVATLCLEAQERREMAERQYRDRDDRYR